MPGVRAKKGAVHSPVLVKCLDYGSARTFSTVAVSSTYRRRTYPAIPTTRPSRNGMRQPQASSAAVDMLARRDERRRAREPVTNPEVADVRSSPGSIQAVAARPPCLEARRYFAMGAELGPPLLEASLALAASRVSFWRDMLQLKLLSGEERHKLEKGLLCCPTCRPSCVVRWCLRGVCS